MKRLYAALSSHNLKGDPINGIPTIFDCKCLAENEIQRLRSIPSLKSKYHNPIHVEWNPTEVNVIVEGIATGERILMCSFKEL